MEIEQTGRNKPKFAVVAVLFAATILVVLIGAAIVVTWRAKSVNKAPFTKHPVSMLALPDAGPSAAQSTPARG